MNTLVDVIQYIIYGIVILLALLQVFDHNKYANFILRKCGWHLGRIALCLWAINLLMSLWLIIEVAKK